MVQLVKVEPSACGLSLSLSTTLFLNSLDARSALFGKLFVFNLCRHCWCWHGLMAPTRQLAVQGAVVALAMPQRPWAIVARRVR